MDGALRTRACTASPCLLRLRLPLQEHYYNAKNTKLQ